MCYIYQKHIAAFVTPLVAFIMKVQYMSLVTLKMR